MSGCQFTKFKIRSSRSKWNFNANRRNYNHVNFYLNYSSILLKKQWAEQKWITIKHNRSSRLEVFCKKAIQKKIAKFTGRHLCHSLLFKQDSGTNVFRSFSKHDYDSTPQFLINLFHKKSKTRLVSVLQSRCS